MHRCPRRSAGPTQFWIWAELGARVSSRLAGAAIAHRDAARLDERRLGAMGSVRGARRGARWRHGDAHTARSSVEGRDRWWVRRGDRRAARGTCAYRRAARQQRRGTRSPASGILAQQGIRRIHAHRSVVRDDLVRSRLRAALGCCRRWVAMMKNRTFAAARAIPLALLAVACATTHPENPALDAFPAGVAGSTDVTYYDVHGTTARELVADMRRLGPKTETGASFFGETQSPLRWEWKTRHDGPNCTVSDVSVYVRSEITLAEVDTAARCVARARRAMETVSRRARDARDRTQGHLGSCRT